LEEEYAKIARDLEEIKNNSAKKKDEKLNKMSYLPKKGTRNIFTRSRRNQDRRYGLNYGRWV